METLTHRDRNGRIWKFTIDCTPRQLEAIRCALCGLRNMGNRAALSLDGLSRKDEDGNLYGIVEAALLKGLAAQFPEPQPLQIEKKPIRPAPVPGEAVQERPRYWWENL